jgi:hypothetical protein
MIRNNFIFCFALLQNAIKTNEFEAILLNIFNLYNSKYFNEATCFSLNWLKDQILHRKLNNDIDVNLTEDSVYIEKKQYLINENTSHNPMVFSETTESLKLSSPFRIYFDSKIQEIKNRMGISNQAVPTVASNVFYSPELFSIIEKMFFVIPFWSGLMLDGKELHGRSRLDNNIVENWLGYLKNSLMLKKLVMPSELAGIICINGYWLNIFNFTSILKKNNQLVTK